MLLFLLYERKRRKKHLKKESCQTVCEAVIIGKSCFKISHSTPQVRCYPKDEPEAKKASTFLSKDADIMFAFRVGLPEFFTITSAEYEAMHSAWHKAIKV
ncbi:DUF3875 domain-containing protein [Porphyromonas gulae]|uniref:DUF3875 domain-containing protein n=1 Tax=Porphyromonas gulae TaxID=111105 RepID=UPI0021CEC435|nr:DUF3875 domain-containing protein [Porphyromonas gulae]